MSKINLTEFDRLVAEHKEVLKRAVPHSLDAIIKEGYVALLKDVDAMITRITVEEKGQSEPTLISNLVEVLNESTETEAKKTIRRVIKKEA